VAHQPQDSQAQIHALVCAAQAGHRAAFEELLGRYERYVFKLARGRLKNYHDAEDVAQNVFVEAFLNLQRLHDPCKFAPWLRRLTLNLCADSLRRKSIVTAAADETLQLGVESSMNDARDAPPCEEVQAAIRNLSNTLRETIELHYLQNCPIKEISARLGVPLGTIKRRLHEARRRLREKSSADP